MVEAATRLELGNLTARRLICGVPSEPNRPEKQKGRNVYTISAEKMGHVVPIENRLQKSQERSIKIEEERRRPHKTIFLMNMPVNLLNSTYRLCILAE